MGKILLVEDSKSFKDIVTKVLGHCEILWAENIKQGLEYLNNNKFDLILLDLTFPDGDGHTFLSEVSSWSQDSIPSIICLTERTEVTNKVTAFSLGVDDYITKPIDVIEFRARVDAKMRKSIAEKSSTQLNKFGPFKIDYSMHKVFIQFDQEYEEVFLTHTEYKLFVCLGQNIGDVHSRESLLSQVWGNSINVFDRVVDVHICSLRKKIGNFGAMIKSVPGVGYRLDLSAVRYSKVS